MAVAVTVASWVKAAAVRLSPAGTRIRSDLIRLVLVMGVNQISAGIAHPHAKPAEPGDRALGFGGTNELMISAHHRVGYQSNGTVLTVANLAPVAPLKS